MPKGRIISNKIASIKKTRKITNAMQMIAAGKRRKLETNMQTSLPYANKIAEVLEHVLQSNVAYRQLSYLRQRPEIKRIGILVISTDRGLCGGLNISLFKKILTNIQEWQRQGINADLFLIGGKAALFFKNLKINIKTQYRNVSDMPAISDLIGTIKVAEDAYNTGEIDKLYLAYNEFINTVSQKPKIVQLLPLIEMQPKRQKRNWDYIYEPDSISVLKTLLIRYIEIQVYQAVVSNIACEQVARMLAMQNATDNASKFIDDLKIVYNKNRQAAITKEIIEITSGANQ